METNGSCVDGVKKEGKSDKLLTYLPILLLNLLEKGHRDKGAILQLTRQHTLHFVDCMGSLVTILAFKLDKWYTRDKEMK